MNKNFKIEDLDETTLKFAIEKCWARKTLCKSTRDGKLKASAYESIERELQYFLNQITKQES